jgi:hypothetical protein
MPAIEGGAEEQPAGGAENEQPGADVTEGQPSAEESEQLDVASFIDGLAVLFSYGWLACGVLLLLAIPIVLYVFNRWGRRRRQT